MCETIFYLPLPCDSDEAGTRLEEGEEAQQQGRGGQHAGGGAAGTGASSRGSGSAGLAG